MTIKMPPKNTGHWRQAAATATFAMSVFGLVGELRASGADAAMQCEAENSYEAEECYFPNVEACADNLCFYSEPCSSEARAYINSNYCDYNYAGIGEGTGEMYGSAICPISYGGWLDEMFNSYCIGNTEFQRESCAYGSLSYWYANCS